MKLYDVYCPKCGHEFESVFTQPRCPECRTICKRRWMPVSVGQVPGGASPGR